MTLYSGNEFVPVYDNLMGVFCWMRKSDGETTPWETGQDAQEMLAYASRVKHPSQTDETARLAFDAAGL